MREFALAAEAARQILSADLNPDFLETLLREIAWDYDALGTELAENPCFDEAVREEEFNRRRGARVTETSARASRRFGIPYIFRRLECNGQHKLIVKAGRIVLIQEPILYRSDQPTASDYKKSLADMHGLVRQLELDLGDIPYRIVDWSGCILAVLLHGPEATGFRQKKRLGNAFIGVPDAAYRQWVLRVDVQSIAMFGPSKSAALKRAPSIQADNVTVTAKKKNFGKGADNQ